MDRDQQLKHRLYSRAMHVCTLAALGVTAQSFAADRPPLASAYHDGAALFAELGEYKLHETGGIAGGPGISAAAAHVIGQQCGNGGWSWEHAGDGMYSCSSTYANLTGPIGSGLLQAYALTNDSSVLTAAINAANHDMADVFPNTGGTWFGAFSPAFFQTLSAATGDSTYSNNAAEDFFDKLSAGSYGDASIAGYPVDTAGWIARLEAARTGGQINLRPWDLHQLPWVAGQIGTSAQQDLFRNAILSNINQLNSALPGVNPAYFGELIGLAGAVRGLALNNTITFTPIMSTNYPALMGIDNLEGLADKLASYQKPNGSWYWTNNGTGASDEDTQTTAYAVLALIAAQQRGAGPYTAKIAKGRAYLQSIQDVDGGFQSYPGGAHNIEVEAEAMWAIAVPQSLSIEVSQSCFNTSPITVEVWARDLESPVHAYAAFLEYDETVLAYQPSGSSYAGTTFPLHINGLAGAPAIAGELPIDGSTGFGAPPYTPGATDVLLATLKFNVLTECDLTSINFDLDAAFDNNFSLNGVQLATSLSNTNVFSADLTDPVITCPDDIVVSADAGECTAVVDLNNTQAASFDDSVMTHPTQAPEVWYTDRFAPFGFSTVFFDGGNRLRQSINASDCQTCRPPAYQFPFYNTQGRKFNIGGTTSMSIDLYIPSDWATSDKRMAGFWATAFDATASISAYPIFEFTSELVSGGPRFRAWPADPIAGGYVNLGLPTGFAYDQWYTLTITLSRGQATFTVGDKTQTVASNNSLELGNVILQGHNTEAGVTYDIHWDNFTYNQFAIASDNCSNPIVTGSRSDMAPLNAPYPSSSVTTITWIATDACGNTSSCPQTVTVNPVNELVINIDLPGSSNDADPMTSGVQPPTRCLYFVMDDCDADFSQTLTFVDHDSNPLTPIRASEIVYVPCDGAWSEICVKDEQHTQWDTESISIVGTQYVAASAASLQPGDTDNDGDVDIHDVTWLLFTYGDLTAHGDCPWDGTRDADFDNGGAIGTEDYDLLAANWLDLSNCACTVPAQAPIVVSLPVSQLSPTMVSRVDRNRDGVFNHKDVKLFERQHGLKDTLSRKMANVH